MLFTGRDLSRDIPIFGGLRGIPFIEARVIFPGPIVWDSNKAVFEGGLREMGRSFCRVESNCGTEKEGYGNELRCCRNHPFAINLYHPYHAREWCFRARSKYRR
jgi:hypothetical protein